MAANERIKIICGVCGSDNVLRDAYASWDVESQSWVLHSVYDDMRCEDCGYDGRHFEDEPIDGIERAQMEAAYHD